MAFSDIGVVSSIWKAIPELAQDFNLKIYAKDTLAYKKLSECFSPEELKKYNIIPYKQMPIIDAYKIVRNENPAAVITGLSNAHKKTKSGSGMQQQEYKADFAFGRCRFASEKNQYRHFRSRISFPLSDSLSAQFIAARPGNHDCCLASDEEVS